jgi:hypothetical protein
MLHPTEKYYPLRPELAESTFYLYQATKGLDCFILQFFSFSFSLEVLDFHFISFRIISLKCLGQVNVCIHIPFATASNIRGKLPFARPFKRRKFARPSGS